MSKQLLWKFCLVIATGVVALFWIIDLATSMTETGMSFIREADRQQITEWGRQAERLYESGDMQALEAWLDDLRVQENTWVSVARITPQGVAGEPLLDEYYEGYLMGRDVDWQIHLYMEDNPVMEVPFPGSDPQTGFLIRLPERMRPGSNLEIAWLSLQIILPMVLLVIVAVVLYRHIMLPLRQLEQATRRFTQGKFDTRVRQLLGKRNDELSELADTFDHMAERIGTQIISQRQLIADISHELRTPLTRLDLAVQNLRQEREPAANLERIEKESGNIRKLVDDSLTLAWLENERPDLQQESLDLTDLLDVLVEDARFEYPDRKLAVDLPDNAAISNSNHRSLGQALENILRNALRFTPANGTVSISLREAEDHYHIRIQDQGSGVPEQDVDRIFQPFYRSAESHHDSSGFGLGLALARRQIAAVGGVLRASNIPGSGLAMLIDLPKHRLMPAV